MKTIGVLTSGGDAPGMNAAIRSIVRTASSKGIKVMGIKRGYNGLIDEDIKEMNFTSVSDIIHRGGTILYTARSPEFKTEEGMDKAVATARKFGIEGIAVLGGDGSFRGARDLSLRGIPCVGVPCTIDNDIASTEYSIGFDTALNTAIEMVDRLRDTMQSHDRCSVVEIMGRNAGYLALHVGIAVGATVTIVPEVDYDINKDIIDKIDLSRKHGKSHFIIVVAEGVGQVSKLAREIEMMTCIESKACVLGHVQRGGSPSGRDRIMATTFGNTAVELLSQGIGNKVVSIRGNKIYTDDIYEALKMAKEFETKNYEMGKIISI